MKTEDHNQPQNDVSFEDSDYSIDMRVDPLTTMQTIKEELNALEASKLEREKKAAEKAAEALEIEKQKLFDQKVNEAIEAKQREANKQNGEQK